MRLNVYFVFHQSNTVKLPASSSQDRLQKKTNEQLLVWKRKCKSYLGIDMTYTRNKKKLSCVFAGNAQQKQSKCIASFPDPAEYEDSLYRGLQGATGEWTQIGRFFCCFLFDCWFAEVLSTISVGWPAVGATFPASAHAWKQEKNTQMYSGDNWLMNDLCFWYGSCVSPFLIPPWAITIWLNIRIC